MAGLRLRRPAHGTQRGEKDARPFFFFPEGTHQDAGGGGHGDDGARRRAEDHEDLPFTPVVDDLRICTTSKHRVNNLTPSDHGAPNPVHAQAGTHERTNGRCESRYEQAGRGRRNRVELGLEPVADPTAKTSFASRPPLHVWQQNNSIIRR